MSVILHSIGRFGNFLHQYSYARLLAEHYGYSLNVWKHNNQYKDIFDKYFPNATEIKGKELRGSANRLNGRHELTPFNKLKLSLKKPISVYGNFEMFNAVYNNVQQARVKEFLTPIQNLNKACPEVNMYRHCRGKFDKIPSREVTADDIVLHLRSGDLVNFMAPNTPYNSFIDFNYYDQILSMLQFNRLYIVTESNSFLPRFANIFLQPFCKYKPIYVNNPELMVDFNFIRLFDRIILSQSSFAFWSSYLSNAKYIYVPQTVCGAWNVKTIHNRIPSEDRYHIVEENALGCVRRLQKVIKYILGGKHD